MSFALAPTSHSNYQKSMPAHVYMLTNKNNDVLYTGVTTNLPERLEQHKTGKGSKFTAQYNATKLVWVEPFESLADAQAFEHKVKRWRRQWKNELIEKLNPNWDDLSLKM